ncbi:MAG: hypothetical protein IKV00_09475, partial [Clostridia bacterium]|nr:hypothetical protein [Clostridia bacterium]
WKRILEVESTSEAAALLYDIKNARKVKEGDLSIDALGIYAVNTTTVEIFFEEKLDANGSPAIDYNGFMRNLTSYALVPLREMIVSRTDDWAKKPATMVCSGPFTLRKVSYDKDNRTLVLERNAYYLRDKEVDDLDKKVTPYRLVIDYTKTEEEIMAAYEAGEIFYVGDIPLSLRGDYASVADVRDEMSTHTYYLNEKAIIGGKALFAEQAVREALSLALDREAIANAVVFAKAATALVPYGVFDANSAKKQFRAVGGDLISSAADMSAAKAKLSAAGIDPSQYTFAITVAAYDEVHVAIAEMVKDAWCELGFKVKVNAIDVETNDDLGTTGEVATDIKDDIFAETIRSGDYQVAAVDLVAYTPDAFGILAPFAKGFSGQGMDMDLRDENNQPYYVIPPHKTGFDNEEYNALIEKAYATTSASERATILHDAEKALMASMPVIPIVFNQTATLTSKDLSGVKTSYYGTSVFSGAKLKDYEKYIPEVQ